MARGTAITLPTHLTKAVGVVEISEPAGQLSLTDRRLFNFLLAHAYPSLGRRPAHVVRLADIRGFAAMARDGIGDTDNRRLKNSIERLQKTLVAFNYLDSDKSSVWQSSQLLGTCILAERTGELTYMFPAGLEERLAEPALYSYISLRVIYQFESKYALILYEILKRYADREAAEPYWAVKTSELRDLLGCRERLKDWKDFRRRALDPALDEIDRLSEFAVEVFEVRQGGGRGGGRVVGLTFRIRRKERQEAEAVARELEKPRLQRRGERRMQRQDQEVAAALRWLSGSEATVRFRWQKRAEELGLMLPAAASAPENLAKWVPAIAQLICLEENLI
ncbi:MAG: replication initiation protein [Alphaproteobacteria bacterium]